MKVFYKKKLSLTHLREEIFRNFFSANLSFAAKKHFMASNRKVYESQNFKMVIGK